jgi:hypothetical protein
MIADVEEEGRKKQPGNGNLLRGGRKVERLGVAGHFDIANTLDRIFP